MVRYPLDLGAQSQRTALPERMKPSPKVRFWGSGRITRRSYRSLLERHGHEGPSWELLLDRAKGADTDWRHVQT